MPRTELAAFDRHYLDHGLLTTWDGSVTMLAGTGVGGGTLVNWMTCIDAPSVRPRRVGDRPRPRRRDGRGLGGRRRRHRTRARRRRLDPHPAEGRDRPARRPGARLGGRARRAATPTPAATAGAAGSAARAGRSGRGSASTWPRRPPPARGSSPDARVTRVLVEGGRAVGVEADVAGRRTAAPPPAARRARPDRGPRRGRPADAGHPPGAPG